LRQNNYGYKRNRIKKTVYNHIEAIKWNRAGLHNCPHELMGWRNVLKRWVNVRVFWDPCSPRWIVPEIHCPCIDKSLALCNTYIVWCIMTGMYQGRYIVFPGRIILGTRGPRKKSYRDTSFQEAHHPTHELAVGWRDVLKRFVPAQMFWDPWSIRWIV